MNVQYAEVELIGGAKTTSFDDGFMLSLWFKAEPDSFYQDSRLFSNEDQASGAYSLQLSLSGDFPGDFPLAVRPRGRARISSNGRQRVELRSFEANDQPLLVVTPRKWHQMALLCCKTDQIRLYIDGKEAAANVLPNPGDARLTLDYASPLTIGGLKPVLTPEGRDERSFTGQVELQKFKF